MSNYNKSYNFTNGLQVDDSNFVVTANGLVGIGTTVPQKTLDVRGNAQINGGLDLNSLNVTGIVTVGAGITLDATSGIITATKFIGDASSLTNIVAISTIGLIANAGSLSTTAKLGIGSITPTKQLDVIGDSEFNGDVNISGILTTGEGVKILSGGINASGVITAPSLVIDDYIYHAGDTNTFIGFESNDTIRFNTNGSDKLKINTSGHLILLDDQDTYIYHPSEDIISVVTGGSERFSVSGTGVTVTGEVSATGAVRGTSFSGHSGVPADFSNGLIATASTFTDDVEFHGVSGITSISFDKSDNSLKFVDDAKLKFGSTDGLEIYHSQNLAGTNDSYIDSSARNLYVRLNTGTDNGGNIALQAKKDEHGVLIEDDAGVKLYFNGDLQFETIGAGASVYDQINVARLNGGTSGLSSHFGSLRYGNESGSSPYSTRRSLDIINADSGNINFYIDAENRGSAGDFHWHKGFNNDRLMTLTSTGLLGIGETQPNSTLHVNGISTVTGASYVDGNFYAKSSVEIDGSADIQGNLSVNGTFSLNTTLNADVIGGVTGDLAGNVVATGNTSIFHQVGIKTDLDKVLSSAALDVSQGSAVFKNVGIGSTSPDCILDVSGGTSAPSKKFILLPKVSAGGTSLLQSDSVEGGALIYNTTLRKLQFFNGNNWETVTSVEA